MAVKQPFKKTWTVRRSGAKRATAAGMTQDAAWREARRLARKAGVAAFLMDAKTGHVSVMNDYSGEFKN